MIPRGEKKRDVSQIQQVYAYLWDHQNSAIPLYPASMGYHGHVAGDEDTQTETVEQVEVVLSPLSELVQIDGESLVVLNLQIRIRKRMRTMHQAHRRWYR